MNYQYQTKDDQAYQSLSKNANKYWKIMWIAFIGYFVFMIPIGYIDFIKSPVYDIIAFIAMVPAVVFAIKHHKSESKAQSLIIKPEFPVMQSDEASYKKIKKFHTIISTASSISLLIIMIYVAIESMFNYNPFDLNMIHLITIVCLLMVIVIATESSLHMLRLLRKQYLKYHKENLENK